ncbi:stAR-related lipid transfer protein 6 [Bombina bombina]|uniref:stAR-related lipid transfer protein 6 n=1 Tax=Bombina bombina TaxID=8345 RepID=UPI00235A52C5|nr:stAR-related lipid transfer protein 6 [Bombina bombina]
MDYFKIAADVSEKILSYNQDTTGWKLVKSSKNVVVSWKPSNEYPGNIYRGEGVMEGTPEKIIPFMYLPEYRSKWDKALQHYSLLERIDEDTAICHIVTHSYGMGIISSREFIDLIHIRKFDGGVITTNSVSVEYEKFPVSTSSHVRGHNNPCGYVCSPIPNDPSHSKLVAFIQPELGGLLPRSVVESAIPSNIVNLINDARTGLKQYLSPNKN